MLAIVYGSYGTGLQKKAVEVLSSFLLDYTFENPVCISYYDGMDLSAYRCIYIGTSGDKRFIGQNSPKALTYPEEYFIRVWEDGAMIQGGDDAGVLYGCVDFYNHFIVQTEHTHDDRYWINPADCECPECEYGSA